MRKKLVIAIVASSIVAAGCTREPTKTIFADWVLYDGVVVTVNSSFDVEEAIAIRGEEILAVGQTSEIQGHIGPDTRTIDLDGKTVIPGLIDGHSHFLKNAVSFTYGADVALVSSIDEMVKRIGEKVNRASPGQLVYTTSGWLPQQLEENRTPTRDDLDPVSPDNPVVVMGGHSVYLNSYALREAGIDENTVSPEGGTIVKDPETGRPTGRLIENASYLATTKWDINEATHEQKVEAIRKSEKALNAVGITSIREPGISAADMRVYQDLLQRGELSVRVSMNYSLDPSRPANELISELQTWGVSTGFGNTMLRLDGVGEFGIDGGFEAGLMSEHYVHVPGNEDPEEYFGLQRIPTEKFEEVMSAMSMLGWRGSVHVVGDRGLDIVLDAYEKASETRPIAPKRWVIEHAHYTRPDQFARIRDLDLVISTQFHPFMAAQNMAYFWGEERAANAMRMRDWLDAGLVVGGGSDWTLMPANPFWMIYFWVTRDTRLGGPIGRHQQIGRDEALRVMTINNAYITFEEDIKGSLETGKLADMVVISDNILTVRDEQIKDIEPIMTILGGKVVYQAADSLVVNKGAVAEAR